MEFKLNLPVNRMNRASREDWLLLTTAFSCFLLFVRLLLTGSFGYVFLVWNLALAFVPYYITNWLTKNVQVIESGWKCLIVLTIWLLFIPNSFYIITDLFHLGKKQLAPVWFDLLLIFSFAWIGMVVGILSLRKLEELLKAVRGKSFSIAWIFAVMWLCAFGIYIGRFLRFNSWDVITDPFSLASEILDLIFHPLRNGYVWGMTLCYALFMTMVYYTTKRLNDIG